MVKKCLSRMSGKLSRTVLRRGKGSNPFSLVDYINKAYQDLLKEKGIIASMSRKGNCWDNALAENFFSHFKCECLRINKHLINSYENVEKLVESYLHFYNNERLQARLKNMSPVSYRKQYF